MILVGIDVAKDKHDCCIINSDGEVLCKTFTILNNHKGFDILYGKICSVATDLTKIKVGLEATGHYSINILTYLLGKKLTAYVINPLRTNLYRKGLSLRKTKTDRIDARAIALLLLSDPNLKPYSQLSYHREELKSLTRYRASRVRERSKLKVSVKRLVTILFPELLCMKTKLHADSIYAMLSEFPGASYIASANIIRLTNILRKKSGGRFNKTTAIQIRNTARESIGTPMKAKSFELRNTISLIQTLDKEIDEIESEIAKIMKTEDTIITSIPGISFRSGASIIAEIGDFSRFDSPDKLLAYVGISPSTYQSGKLYGSHSRMEKRGSPYLRYALIYAAEHVCMFEPGFAAYLARKRAEGKPYNVAVSHAAKRLVRLIYAMETSQTTYKAA